MSGRFLSVEDMHRGMTEFPAIRTVIEHMGLTETVPFRDHSVLAVQHVQKSLVPLIDALVLGGVEPAHIAVVGKSYSTMNTALESLSRRRVAVSDPRRMNDQTRSYEHEMAQRVAGALEAVTEGRERPLLILDEGGLAVRALRHHGPVPARVAVVEQTTRGTRAPSADDIRFPLVDVARSAAKIDLEGPLVAASMWRSISGVAREFAVDLGTVRIGLIGFGTVGRNLAAHLLGAGLEVVVADVDDGHLGEAAAAGMVTAPVDGVMASCGVILGCTGVGIIDSHQLDLLMPDVYLINCASSDIEFRLWAHRRSGAVVGGLGTDASRPWDCHFRIGDTPRILIAGGFAVNFYNTDEPISSSDFQITRALMLAGAVQAVGSTTPGLVELDGDLQQVIRGAYRATSEGERLI